MKCATVKGLSHISLCWKMPTVIIGQMRWGRIMVTSPTCLLAGKDMECQKYRDKYCGNCVKHHTYKETAVELQHFKTNHSPTTRSISEATAQDTHHRHHSARQPAIPHAHFHKHPLTIEMKVFFSRRLEAKQAVPHVDTCFRKHPLNTNSRRITAFQNQPFPNFFFFTLFCDQYERGPSAAASYGLDFRSTCSRHAASAYIGITAHDNQPFPMHTLDFTGTHSR